MKRILAFWRKARGRITVTTGNHPVLMTIILFLFINVVVILIASVIALALDGAKYINYDLALWDATRWLLFPGSAASADESVFVLAICAGISGTILFTGTVIAVTTNYLRAYIAKKTENRGKLLLSNHIVILNYNSQVLAMLTDLMHNGAKETVLVLSDKTKDFVCDELAGEIAGLKEKPSSKLNLIVRKGDPNSAAELNDINIKEAKGILIMDDESKVCTESDISTADFDTIKLVMRLSNFEISPNCPIAIEAESYKTAEMIQSMKNTVTGLKNKSIEVFSYNRKLGQFLALSILYPEMTSVLYNLLSFTGCMFYPVEAMPIEKYLHKYTGSIPIITFDKTFVLTQSIENLREKREKPYKTERLIKPLEKSAEKETINLYIIGKNKKLKYMLEAMQSDCRHININSFEASQRAEFLTALENATHGKTIAVVLSEDTKSEGNRDENVFLTLIEINQKFGTDNRPFKIIAEILEPKNQENIEQFNIKNIIISSRIISFFTTKLITNANSDKFYENVFTHSMGNNNAQFTLCIDDAKNLFDLSHSLNFRSNAELVMSIYHGSDAKMMPLGIIRDNQIQFFCTEMDKKQTVHLKQTDKFIYINYNN